MKIMRQLKHKDKRRKPRPFHVHNGRLLFSGVSKHALTTKGQDLLSNKRKKFTGFLMAVYIRQQVQSNNTTDGAVTSTFAIKMSFKLLVYMEKIVQQRRAIRVRWVVEFPTRGHKVSLILRKNNGFQKNGVNLWIDIAWHHQKLGIGFRNQNMQLILYRKLKIP